MTHEQFRFLAPTQAERPYTVSEINEGISLILESGNAIVWVEGEVSNWRVSSNGHSYFRLKDAECQVPAVMWRQTIQRLSYIPEDGLAVLAIASIKVYRKSGYYQLDVHRMEPRGKGALHIAFEQLKKKLEKEGLFDQNRKKALPDSIARLGVITSKNGAAIRDIVRVVASRAPQTDIVLADVPVQGETSAKKIAQAIGDMNAYGTIDCIIVGRGGGSSEDLQAFNEEIVARAIAASAIPIISAVGHEIDFTISDFVADVRAPTPSAAAEMAVPDNMENRKYFDACASRFAGAFVRKFENATERYELCVSSRAFRRTLDKVLDFRQEVDHYADQCSRLMSDRLHRARERWRNASARLQAVSPLSVLSRGYSVVTIPSGAAVRNSADISPGDMVAIRFEKGSADAQIVAARPE